MDKNLIGKILTILGAIALIMKIVELFIISKGCFGHDYLYEVLSFFIPVIMIVVGFKLKNTEYKYPIK